MHWTQWEESQWPGLWNRDKDPQADHFSVCGVLGQPAQRTATQSGLRVEEGLPAWSHGGWVELSLRGQEAEVFQDLSGPEGKNMVGVL